MNYYLKISLILLGLVLVISAVQTIEHRFDSFDDYLNKGYGNVPYTIKH